MPLCFALSDSAQSWHIGVDVFAPLVYLATQFLHLFGHDVGEVVLLPEVFREVEQVDRAVFEPLDQFPIAAANRTERTAAIASVVGLVPKQSIVQRPVFAFQQ